MTNRPLESLSAWTRDWLSAWNAHDIERVVSRCAPDYEGMDIAQAESHHGPEGMRRYAHRYLEAFPDLELTLDELVTEEPRVSVAWTARGTHQGLLMNIPPTGHTVTVRGISILTLEQRRIVQALYVWDVAGLLRAIGLLPELPSQRIERE